jgi:sigma-B regulation protein RsbU (phosphoserine phosphatase)
MLTKLLAAQPERFALLAQAWRDGGAAVFGVRSSGGEVLAVWPGGAVSQAPDMLAPISNGISAAGALFVIGLTGPQAQARLNADASWLAHLLNIEGELDEMTAELIDSQDQLLALYDLAQSMRSRLQIDDVLYSLAAAAVRLVKVQGAVAAIYGEPGESGESRPAIAHYPRPLLNSAVFGQLFQETRANRRETLFGPRSDLPDITNLLIEPIRVRGTICAALGLVNKPGGFTSPDLKLVRTIAEQAGAQIENVLLYQESLEQARFQTEIELARHVQTHLLPQSLPQITGLDIASGSHPALEVGGDFYDFIFPPGAPLVFVVGDVAGKGMPAALLMTMTRTMLRSKAKSLSTFTPEVVVFYANEDMYDDFTDVGMFATVFIGQYWPDSRQLMFANAGHSPVMYCPAGGPSRLLEADGPPIGVLPASECRNQSLVLRPGDVLVVATDGFSEARNGADTSFGYERLLGLVESLADRSAQGIVDGLFEAVRDFENGHAQEDDRTLIVVKGTAL